MASSPTPLSPPVNGSACSCGSGKLFEACCGPVLSGQQPAENAEKLMRARFTAHVAQDHKFLHFSFAGTAKLPFVDPQLSGRSPWTRLEIHSHELGASPDVATVEFTAFYAANSIELPHLEKAEFHKIDGKWIYTKALRVGPAPVRATAPKVGRNDPCPCGSGKKYKHCCLKA